MPRAIRIHQNGGPEVMRFEEVELGSPARGEVRLRHSAIGINFSDVNVRLGGFYFGKGPQFPLALGNEAAGLSERTGGGGCVANQAPPSTANSTSQHTASHGR